MQTPIKTEWQAACAAGNINPLDPKAWNSHNVTLESTLGTQTSKLILDPTFYSDTALWTGVATPPVISWADGTKICSNMVKYLEVLYTFDSSLNLQTARARVVYGEYSDLATSFPVLVYTSAALHVVKRYLFRLVIYGILLEMLDTPSGIQCSLVLS